MAKSTLLDTDEYACDGRLTTWGDHHKTVCPAQGEDARAADGDGLCEVHVHTMEGFWSRLGSWLRPHRGISPEKLASDLGFFPVVPKTRHRGEALRGAPVGALVA